MLFLSALLCSCSPQLCLQIRTDRTIKRFHNQVDTVYMYSVAFNNFNLVWFHKGNLLHSFMIKPHDIKRYKPIESKSIAFEDKDLDKYFRDYLPNLSAKAMGKHGIIYCVGQPWFNEASDKTETGTGNNYIIVSRDSKNNISFEVYDPYEKYKKSKGKW